MTSRTKGMLLALLIAAVASTAIAQQVPQAIRDSKALGKVRTPFDQFPRVATQIHVYDRSQFTEYVGPSVSRFEVSEEYQRRRLGTVMFAPGVRVHVDRLDHLYHGPAYFELLDVNSAKSLGTIDIGLVSPTDEEAKLLFSGQGVVYAYQRHPSLCAGHVTLKLALTNDKLTAVTQPLVFVGADSSVTENTKVFAGADGSSPVVAELRKGTKVTVLGLAPDLSNRNLSEATAEGGAVLIRTPLGLTGWFLPKRSEGSLTITQCN